MAYVVTAPLVVTYKPDGSHLYLYEGAELPDYIEASEIKRLGALGMVSKAADGSPSKQPTAQSN